MRLFRRAPLARQSPFRRAIPKLEVLEDRMLPAADPLFGQFQNALGLLNIHGGGANSVVVASLSASGFVQVNVGDQFASSDPHSASYDPALAGATGQTLKAIQLDGSATLDQLVLGNLSVAGGLSVQSDGVLDVQGQVSAAGAIQLTGQTVLLSGQVRADGSIGGDITVTAGNVLQSGLLEADGSQGDGGAIHVDFTGQYLATVSSITSANSTGTGSGGLVAIDGGSTGTLSSSGNYQANAAQGGQGGDIDLFAQQVQLVGANIGASGPSGGGWVRVGGDSPADIAAHGGSAVGVSYADTTTVDATTTLTTNALSAGNGGRIVVWSQESTTFGGTLTAQGAGANGAGGLLEVSSAGLLTYGGHANADATSGQQGRLLLDPKNLIISAGVGLPHFNLLNPKPDILDTFGSSIVTLSNGNVFVADPTSGLAGLSTGAVFLYNGQTGALLETLTGSTTGDDVGSGGVTALSNGNFVVSSPNWQDDGAAVGAATWISGSADSVAVVSAANSLIGATSGDEVGFTVTALPTNGNYVVSSPFWQDGGAQVGAVTWGDGATGTVGAVSASNSLVGSNNGDDVGSDGVTALTNGNYVVSSSFWQNPNGSYGAVTWGNGAGGIIGPVSAANSLIGDVDSGGVGGAVTALSDGNYVVISSGWQDDGNPVGAVTWGNGITGTVALVAAANSLTGATSFDSVGGGGVTALTNGNYVVASPDWHDDAGNDVGAVTFGQAGGGTVGPVSASNSLVGSTDGDDVGSGGVTALGDGSYVVSSPDWQNAGNDVGAVTWSAADGSTVGAVTTGNSLVGSTNGDNVGSGGVTALTNGNYVVSSPDWQNAGNDVGAVTWSNGDGSTVGPVTASNSLVGSTNGDNVGSGGVTALTNGNYVVSSPDWQNAGNDVGAVTWSAGDGSTVGPVTTTNSLVGSTNGDQVGSGGVTALSNGNYVVSSPDWQQTAGIAVGAVTWSDGSTGQTLDDANTIDAVNSLIGSGLGFSLAQVVGVQDGNAFLAGFSGDGGTITVVQLDATSEDFAVAAAQDITVSPSFLTATLDTGTAVVLQASNDITVNSPIVVDNHAGAGGALTLQAGRDIVINADITTDDGNLTLIANDTAADGVVNDERDAGAAAITMAAGTALDAGSGDVTVTIGTGAGISDDASGDITLGAITANNINLSNDGPGDGALTVGDLTFAGSATLTAPGITITGNVNVGAQTLTLTSNAAANLNGATTLAGGTISDSSGLVVGSGASLSGSGTLQVGTGAAGVLVDATATLSPGLNPAGLTINGDLTLAAASIVSELVEGASQFAELNVNGAIDLGNATLEVDFQSPYQPAAFAQFQILSNGPSTAITGTFAQGSILTVGDATLTIDYASGADNNVNLIVQGAPASVNSLPSFSPASFSVSWSGTEYAQGATAYNVYVSDDDGSFTLWQSDTTQTSATYPGAAGHTYAFFSVYTDDDGTQAEVSQASTTVKVVPTIIWNSPADITYGTALSGTQLNASASVIVDGSPTTLAGTYDYTPAAGTLLGVGNDQTLSVTFMPTDNTDYAAVTTTVVINVQAATPTFSDLSSPTIAYGTATTVVSGHLNANADAQPVPADETVQVTINGVTHDAVLDGSDNFSTTFATGALGVAGSAYTIGFSYAGDANFDGATGSGSLTVNQVVPTITWTNPADITYGTPLSGTQLNASASVIVDGSPTTLAGNYDYTPAAGTVLGVGNGQTLSVTFMPTDNTDYAAVTTTVVINVQAATPTFSDLSSPTIAYGTATTVVSGHLNANAGAQVQVTFDGVTQNAMLDGSDNFSTTFATGAVNVAGSAYPIGFSYAGDANFNGTTGSGSLTVNTNYSTTPAENENGTPTAVTVSSLLGSHYSDPDGAANTKPGIAVFQTNGTGTWQYSTTGTTWIAITGVAQTQALLLPGTDSVRFVPAANFSGQANLDFVAWDGSQGKAGASASVAVTGGTTPFSVNAGTLSVTVNPVPRWVGTGAALTSLLPGTYTTSNQTTPAGNSIASVFGPYFQDNNGAVHVGVAITSVTGLTSGTWQFLTVGGATWTNFPTVSATAALLLSANDQIRFVPRSTFVGTVSLNALAWDGSAGTDGAIPPPNPAHLASSAFSTATLTANIAVNRAPTLSGSTTITAPTVAQYAVGAPVSVASLLTNAHYADPDGAKLPQGIAITGTVPNQGSVQYLLPAGTWQTLPSVSASAALLLPSTASLRFVAGNQLGAGAATLTFVGWDQTQGSAGQTFNTGGGGGASAFSIASATLSFTVTASTNHAPSLSTTAFAEPAATVSATGAAITISSLLIKVGYVDQNGSTVPRGIAVTGAAAAGGVFQYQLAGGTWQTLPSVSASSALLLPSTASLRLVAGSQLGTTATLMFAGWDQTQGSAGQLFNIVNTNGASAFSATSAAVSIPVGQAPSWNAASGAALTALLPGAYLTSNNAVPGNTIAAVFGSFFLDANLGSTVGVAVSAATGTGTWQYSTTNGVSWTTFATTLSKTSAVLLSANDLIRFVPRTTAAMTGTLTAYAWDGTLNAGTHGTAVNLTQLGTGGASAFSATTLVASSPFNTAPILTKTSVALLTDYENVSSTPVTAASLLANAGYSDPDGRTLPSGIAVTGDTGTGTWEWLNGAAWTALPSLSSSSVFLLPSTAQLRFLPADNLATNTNGSATLTYLGWDQTAGLADKTFALTSEGGATAFTTASATASMAINFVKQAPTWLAGASANFTPVLGFSATANPAPSPAGDTVSAVFGSAFHDAAGALVGVAISAQSGTAFGGWQYNAGAGWQSFPTTLSAGAALLLSANDLIRFVPTTTKSFSGTVSLTAYAWDGTGTFASNIANVTKTGIGGIAPFSATTLTANCFVNSAPILSA